MGCDVDKFNGFNGNFSSGEILFVEVFNKTVFERETGVVNPLSAVFEIGVETKLFCGVFDNF